MELFIYLFSTDREDKEWQTNAGSWDKHYIEEPFNINRTVPRLYIYSCNCIFTVVFLILRILNMCNRYIF